MLAIAELSASVATRWALASIVRVTLSPAAVVPWSWSRIEENSFFWPVSTPFSERSIPAWPTWMKL